MTALLERPDATVPSKEETELATESSRLLAKQPKDGALRVRLDDGQELTLPKSVTSLLAHILTEMSHGNAVTMIPVHAEMTTQEAAEFLNVSRPHLVHLLERGEMEFHMVGTHRRIKFQQLQSYKNRVDETGKKAREALTKEAQDLNMGYE
jgi:excisionase family DNA binding protein